MVLAIVRRWLLISIVHGLLRVLHLGLHWIALSGLIIGGVVIVICLAVCGHVYLNERKGKSNGRLDCHTISQSLISKVLTSPLVFRSRIGKFQSKGQGR